MVSADSCRGRSCCETTAHMPNESAYALYTCASYSCGFLSDVNKAKQHAPVLPWTLSGSKRAVDICRCFHAFQFVNTT